MVVVFCRSRERPDQLVLRSVGVLVLVDEYVPKAPPVMGGDVGMGTQHIDRGHDEVVEVHCIGLPEAALVGGVGVGEHLGILVRCVGRSLLGRDEVVLQV